MKTQDDKTNKICMEIEWWIVNIQIQSVLCCALCSTIADTFTHHGRIVRKQITFHRNRLIYWCESKNILAEANVVCRFPIIIMANQTYWAVHTLCSVHCALLYLCCGRISHSDRILTLNGYRTAYSMVGEHENSALINETNLIEKKNRFFFLIFLCAHMKLWILSRTFLTEKLSLCWKSQIDKLKSNHSRCIQPKWKHLDSTISNIECIKMQIFSQIRSFHWIIYIWRSTDSDIIDMHTHARVRSQNCSTVNATWVWVFG